MLLTASITPAPVEEYPTNTTEEYSHSKEKSSEYSSQQSEHGKEESKHGEEHGEEYEKHKSSGESSSSDPKLMFPNPALVTAYNGDPPVDSVSEGLAIFIYVDLALLTVIVQFFDVFFVYISNEL